jgi:hypothetical protein
MLVPTKVSTSATPVTGVFRDNSSSAARIADRFSKEFYPELVGGH